MFLNVFVQLRIQKTQLHLLYCPTKSVKTETSEHLFEKIPLMISDLHHCYCHHLV